MSGDYKERWSCGPCDDPECPCHEAEKPACGHPVWIGMAERPDEPDVTVPCGLLRGHDGKCEP